MSRPVIIGLTGPARCGKDTSADYLLKLFSLHKASFADPLKHMLMVGLGLSHADCYGGQNREQPHPVYGVSPRSMMQTLGTEWGRTHVCPDVWIKAMDIHVQRTLCENSFHRGVIIPDVRFANEAQWIRERGHLIHIERDHRPQMDGAGHVSELGIAYQGGDLIVRNNGDLAQLYSDLETIANDIRAARCGGAA